MSVTGTLLGIVVATLGGAAVGVERQQSGHASGRQARFGGVRTFTLLGGLAGLAGWLTGLGYEALAVVLAGGEVALVVTGYFAASRRDVDATTEVAALVVIGAGVAAGIGWIVLASGIVAICTLLLIEKSELHALVERIDEQGFRAAARFAVMAAVILPLLPEGPIGPWGTVKPRELWLLVLFFSGLSFSGYVARRLWGPKAAYPVGGILGGLISSTNVTYTFARLSVRERELSEPLAIGAVGACTMLFPRVLLAATVLNAGVARALLPYVAAPFALGVVTLLFWWSRTRPDVGNRLAKPANPLQFGPALQMAALFQVVLFIVAAIRPYLSGGGLLLTGAVLGLTDVDALTISMTKVVAAGGQELIAAQAIVCGIVANSLLKIGLASLLGTSRFVRVTGLAVGGMALAMVIALAVAR